MIAKILINKTFFNLISKLKQKKMNIINSRQRK